MQYVRDFKEIYIKNKCLSYRYICSRKYVRYILLDYCRRHPKDSEQARAAVPMGRWADLPAYGGEAPGGVYMKPLTGVVSTLSREKLKKAPFNIQHPTWQG